MLQTAVRQAVSHEPSATTETVLEKVRGLLPGIRDRAQRSEESRSIPKESAQEFLDIGLARILTPKKFGGTELGLHAWLDVAIEIGKADAAHAWCASLLIHHPHYLAQFPEAAQAAVWGDGPDVPIACTFTPTSTLEQVEGGFNIVSCSIPYLSGINHSDWVMIGGMVPPTSEGPPDWMLFLIPPGKFRVLDTWQTAGMRGTGSNTVVVENVFVPFEHTLRVADMRDAKTPGAQVHKARMYHAPWITYAPLTFLAPMLGAARGALEDYRSWTAKRASLFGAQVAEFVSIQVHLARAGASLDAAELLMRRCVDVAEAGEPASEQLRARTYRDQARASELIVEAMDTVMKISGAAGFAATSNIQRAWRDVHFAASHVILNPEVSFAAWGRQQFGLERDSKQNMY
ncbi:acyl-CoA dehydrogenase family protein [uncultured Caballeronia sp.]|uniref:acyl-CoA dehydrogenase family protein n=1 Tax=uncultured Caballeronia sp. TaxID=1827198 RepID=UPI001574F9C6